MHLRSRNLPRPSASSPLDNRAPPMTNASQVPDLEAPSVPDVERSRHSNRSGDRSHNVSTERARGRCRAPSLSLRERSSSSESSQTRSRVRRGRSPRRGDHTKARDKSTSQRIRDLDARLDAINTRTNALVTVDTLVRQTDPLFTERVLGARISSKFKLPTQLGIYEGKTDPMDHLDSYKSLMSLQGCSDEVMCKAFSATLKGPARSWFQKLSPGTIDSFGKLSRLFVANFMSCRNRQKNASHLFTVHQKETESLKDFVKRFNQAILELEDPSDKVIIMAMMEGLRPGPLFDSLSKNVPETLSTLQSKADKIGEVKGDQKVARQCFISAMKVELPFNPPNSNHRWGDDTGILRDEIEQLILETRERPRIQTLEEVDKYIPRGVRPNEGDEEKMIIKGKSLILGETTIEKKQGIKDLTEILNARTIGVLALHLAAPNLSYRHSTPLLPKYSQKLSTKNSSSGPKRSRLTPRRGTGTNIIAPRLITPILGRPTLGGIKAITSTYHLKMKFPTLTRIGEVKGDQKVARQCFISAMKVGTSVQSAQ
ncbi:hypothetical protein Acr_27g0010240 [Actinidia rufa]|uniref:Retrotransposon gag domain-containing protein n=1 Tax=Actinidia rufa TaxID=165716 RepID=A0A7J0H8K3_9ERIC|nr:hypothetical protein Acr_27g0010240 [Actinidia rufa]